MTLSHASREMGENPKMIAYCGLDCVECEAYIATQDNDFDALVTLAKKWGENHNTSYRPEDIECEGCQSDRLNKYCNRCGVRNCGAPRIPMRQAQPRVEVMEYGGLDRSQGGPRRKELGE
jgi:hypothetical protein